MVSSKTRCSKTSPNIELIIEFVKNTGGKSMPITFDRNRRIAYYSIIRNSGVENPSVKTLSTILILFIGLNLTATGLAVGICTGQPGCLRCGIHAPTNADKMPADHRCCQTSRAAPCDVEKNSHTRKFFTYLLTDTQTPIRLPNPGNAASGAIKIFDFNPKTRIFIPLEKTSTRRLPLYIQHLSLIC